VLSEAGRPAEAEAWSWPAVSGPVLAVWAREPYRLAKLPLQGEPEMQSGLFSVTGPVEFVLSAVWPVQEKGSPTYARALAAMFERHATALSARNSIMAGDFNSSPGVSGQAKSHRAFVTRAREIGLSSAYHHHEGVEHGDERVGTLRRGKENPKEFHIDYCFVSAALLSSATVTLLRSEEWKKLSDHVPLVLDIPDRTFLDTAQ